MEDDITGVGESSKPDEPTVVINNREVPISKASEVLKQMEHDLKSGYDRKLIEERQAIAAKLEADKEFLNTLPPELWRFYEPTVDGGRGWVGQGDPADMVKATVTSKEKVMENTQTTKPEPSAVDAELQAIRAELGNTKREIYEHNVALSIATRNALSAKYPNADLVAVTAQMEAWDMKNGGKACPDDIIEKFMEQSDTFVTKRIEPYRKVQTETKAAETATPSTSGGTAPSGGKPVLPRLADVDAMAAYVAEQLP